MKVQDMTVEEFKALIEEALEEKLEELLGDPDEGMELRPEIREKLERSLAARAQGEKGVPAEKLAEELGLEW